MIVLLLFFLGIVIWCCRGSDFGYSWNFNYIIFVLYLSRGLGEDLVYIVRMEFRFSFKKKRCFMFSRSLVEFCIGVYIWQYLFGWILFVINIKQKFWSSEEGLGKELFLQVFIGVFRGFFFKYCFLDVLYFVRFFFVLGVYDWGVLFVLGGLGNYVFFYFVFQFFVYVICGSEGDIELFLF